MLIIVLINLIVPRIDEAPAYKNKMAKSTDGPLRAMFPARRDTGGALSSPGGVRDEAPVTNKF